MAKIKSKWIEPEEVMRILGVNDYDLLEYHKKKSLIPYTRNLSPYKGQDIDIKELLKSSAPLGILEAFPENAQFDAAEAIGQEFAEKYLNELRKGIRTECIYWREHVLEFKKIHGLDQPDERRDFAAQQKTVFPCKPGTPWEDITMTLVADNMVRIKTPQGEDRFTYYKLKMSDERSGNKPTILWELVRLFAKNNGFISSQNPNYDPRLPDTARG